MRKPNALVSTLIVVCALVLGFTLGRVTARHVPLSPDHAAPARGTPLKSGPWGKLDYFPMDIAAPAEILPVRAVEEEHTHWFFGGVTRDDMAKLLDSLSVPADQRDQLLDPATLHVLTNGVELAPSCKMIVALPPAARLEIYKRMAGFQENNSQLVFIATASMEERFREYGVSDETIEMLKKLSCSYGRYLVMSGLACLLEELPSFEEKARLMKALTRQKTLLLRVHVGPDTDINGLAEYWGKACWNTDVKATMESLSHIPGGIWVDIVELLPPFPTALLYTFPMPDNPLNGPTVRRDCHWTSFNFFRDPPDPNYSNPAYIRERLAKDYFPVTSDPRYGDLVLFTTPNGTLVHSAVFLADDIVYTKNGDTQIHPWMLSTLSDLLEQYSFLTPPDQKLNVLYYRNKYY